MPIKGKVDLNTARKILNDDLRGVYFGGLKSIVGGTPADKGAARNNWFLTDGQAFNLTSPRSGDSSGSSSLTSIQDGMPKNVLGKKLYFTNNLPYITTLEYGGYPEPQKGSYDKQTKSYVKLSSGGFSLQAPGGWVRKALTKMTRVLANL